MLALKVPTEHAEHTVCPAVAVIVPASHCLQLKVESAPMSLPNVPLGHAVHTLDLAREYEPAEHKAQMVRPLEAAIDPAEHGVHIEDPADAE